MADHEHESEVTRLIDYLRRQQPRGSYERRCYEVALTFAKQGTPCPTPPSDRPDCPPPERKHPLRLV